MLKVLATGICGTDSMRMRNGFNIDSLGHELVVEKNGSYFAACPLFPCLKCENCRAGMSQHCREGKALGRADDGNGGLSGWINIPESARLYPVPASMPIVVAVLADPLACIIHALSEVNLREKSVLLIGDGGLGSISAIFLRDRASHVTVQAKNAGRAEVVRAELGVDAIAALDEKKQTYDIVLSTVSSKTALLDVVPYISERGLFCSLAVHESGSQGVFDLRQGFEKEISFRGAKAYPLPISLEEDVFSQALKVLADSPQEYLAAIGEVIDLRDRVRVLNRLKNGGPGRAVAVNF